MTKYTPNPDSRDLLSPFCVCDEFKDHQSMVSFECPRHGKVTIDRGTQRVTVSGSRSNIGPITDAIGTKRITPQGPRFSKPSIRA